MDLSTSPGLAVVASSVVNAEGGRFALAADRRGRRLIVEAPPGAPWLARFEGDASSHDGRARLEGPLSAQNAAALRAVLPWMRPTVLGQAASAGFGDRLGLATPGHIRALRAVSDPAAPAPGVRRIAPIFAQQSIREMSRTNRTPQQVVDDAAWAVFGEGWQHGYGADADHLKQTVDIDNCLAAGFTFFTIDPGEHVHSGAESLSDARLREAFDALPWDRLEDTAAAFAHRYAGRVFLAEEHRISIDTRSAMVAAVKYGRAVAHVVSMFRHLAAAVGSGAFELEVSLDETEAPTSHGEHVYVTSELKRLGVTWVSLAPRFVGRFEKGVDYIGPLEALRADVAVHAAIARAFGPYKLSLHSGSDKFSIYEMVARATDGRVHLKTAGTSYLEALRTVAAGDAELFAEIYAFSRERYETDRASYHVSATLDAAPPLPPAPGAIGALGAMLDDFHARQILHVTFGSVLIAKNADGTPRFADRLMAVLHGHAEEYAANLDRHFQRHLRPFAG